MATKVSPAAHVSAKKFDDLISHLEKKFGVYTPKAADRNPGFELITNATQSMHIYKKGDPVVFDPGCSLSKAHLRICHIRTVYEQMFLNDNVELVKICKSAAVGQDPKTKINRWTWFEKQLGDNHIDVLGDYRTTLRAIPKALAQVEKDLGLGQKSYKAVL